MFTFNTKKKTINAVLKEIDDRIKELKDDRDEAFHNIEGYAKAKDLFDLRYAIRDIDAIENKIRELELFRITVEYM